MAPARIAGLAAVFARYEGFILDLWGVVHDGNALVPGALPALAALRKARKKIWLLSNAPRRSAVVAEMMSGMGLEASFYDGILTSGEAAFEALRDDLVRRWGRRCLLIGGAYSESVYEGLGLAFARDPSEADFILNCGADFAGSSDRFVLLLEDCAARGLPMLCVNPDRMVHVGNTTIICAGTLADMYAALKGEVSYVGKPYRAVYSRCLQALGTRNVLAVGDSMLTDIAGATGAGLDSVLVMSGIHRDEMPENVSEESLLAVLGRYPYKPTYLVREFSF